MGFIRARLDMCWGRGLPSCDKLTKTVDHDFVSRKTVLYSTGEDPLNTPPSEVLRELSKGSCRRCSSRKLEISSIALCRNA